jgi:hypothetical protein
MTRVLDAFGERERPRYRRTHAVLGRRVRFDCDDAAALALVDAAYARLPRAVASRSPLRVCVRSAPDAKTRWHGAPPEPRMAAGAGWLTGTIDASNYALVDPTRGTALVSISPALQRRAYHARYELLEFAVFTLVARAARHAALHAACIGWRGRGVLLLGDSGAGKSTLCLAALRAGWQLVSEDAVFVAPATLEAFGVPNYLHVTSPSLALLGDAALTARVRASPVIERRSGARKFEYDLRRADARIAARLPLAAIVSLRGEPAHGRSMVRLSGSAVGARLDATQPYARGVDGWRTFRRRAQRLPAFELRRTALDAALRDLRHVLVTES